MNRHWALYHWNLTHQAFTPNVWNKKTLIGFTICAILPYVNMHGRETWNFNGDWLFSIDGGDNAINLIQSADSGNNIRKWVPVNLPHSFSIPYFMSTDFYVGTGWYRKTFQKKSSDKVSKDSRWFMEFDGVFQETDVWINGVKAGSHTGGYTGFTVDITDFLKEGENILLVRADNTWHPDVAPRAGEHTFSGGIYRNVRLVRKSGTYINWYGTAVYTPRLATSYGRDGTVEFVTEVTNATSKKEDYRMVTTIFDPSGKKVARTQTIFRLQPQERDHKVVTRCELDNPRLWSIEIPNRYRYVNELYCENRLLDCEEGKFGFRWFEWTSDKGFFLNGRHVLLNGANVHQDHAGWGDAITDAAAKRDVAMMKEAGFNFIRGSHYPHSPAFSEACDSLGILLWSEAPFWGIGGFTSDGYWNSSAYPVAKQHEALFEKSAMTQLEEMIRIHRNHPSIVVWSMCNEPFFSAPESMEGVRRLLKQMVEHSHRLDSTRPAAVGGVQRPLGNNRIDTIGDVAGYNGDGAMLPDFINPGIPSMVSEYGSVSTDRPGFYNPGWRCLAEYEGWQSAEWRAGYAIWSGFDHGSIAGQQLGKMGIVDYFRIPKRAWYWYRNANRGIVPPEWPSQGVPSKLRLDRSGSGTVKADGTDDVHLLVTVLDDTGRELNECPDITLKIISGPGEFPTGRSIQFSKNSDIRIQDGKAAIEMRSYHSGITEVEASSPGMESARMSIEFTEGISSGPVSEIDRPYIRFERKQSKELLTFGRNNPMFASSNREGHVSGYAGDGLYDTYWQSSENDKNPNIILDTEKGILPRNVSLKFPWEKVWKYKIESSSDGIQWQLVCDHTENKIPCSACSHDWITKESLQYIRVSSLGSGAISEFSAKGYIAD